MSETHNMPPVRYGQGSITSREGVKQQMGRTSIMNVGSSHQGRLSRSTENQALQHVTNKPPTQDEMQQLFRLRPIQYNSLKSGNMSDEEIYKLMNK